MIQRLIEGALGHGEILLPRAGQKVRDVSVQPEVVGAIGRPQPKGAVAALPRHQTLDGVLDAVIQPGVNGQRLGRRERVDIEQRHGPADNLLGTAIGIAIQRLQQGGRVDGAEACHSHIHRAGARHEITQQIARQRHIGARRNGAHAAPIEFGGA